jgi:hypothetical protein
VWHGLRDTLSVFIPGTGWQCPGARQFAAAAATRHGRQIICGHNCLVHTTLRRLTSHATSLVFACFSAAESGQPAARPFDREFLVRRWEILGGGAGGAAHYRFCG